MKRRLITGLLILAGMMSLAFLPCLRQSKESCPACLNATALKEESGSKPSPWDIPAARVVADPHPVFNGVAVDPKNEVVVMSDANRKSLLFYNRVGGGNKATEASVAVRQIMGPETNIGMVAGILVDPRNREIFTVNNDIEDTMLVMSYTASGNAKPLRLLSVPHQAWGVALSPSRDEIAVSVEMHNAVVFYRREANGVEPPLRSIQGPHTGLADPHGVYWDDAPNEIGAANHGNFRGLVKNTGSGCVLSTGEEVSEGGQYQPPSITIHPATGKGDQRPLRTIQGPRTELDWPMGMAVDPAHDEIAVANNGDDSVLIFDRNRGGMSRPCARFAVAGPVSIVPWDWLSTRAMRRSGYRILRTIVHWLLIAWPMAT